MVPDPNKAPGEKDIKPARKAEYARLHASTTGKVIFNQGAADDMAGQGEIEYDNTLYEGHAGLTSDKLANIKFCAGVICQSQFRPSCQLVEEHAYHKLWRC